MTDVLPPGWVTTTLGNVVQPPRSKASPDSDPELPFIGMDSIAANSMVLGATARFGDMKSNGGLFREGDVLYGRMRPYLNKVHRAKFSGACSAEFIVFPESKAIDPDFLAFLLHQRKFVNFASRSSSGDRPRVDFGEVSKYEFGLPPKNEQKRIVSKIDEIFSRIDEGERALDRAQKLVERYRQSVLRAAVTGELTREWREKNKDKPDSGKALLARILKARREAWEKSELAKMKAKGIKPANTKWKQKYEEPFTADARALPALPGGWTWASAEAVCVSVHSGTTPERPLLQATPSSGVPFIKVYNLTFDGSLDFSLDPTYVDAEYHGKHMGRSRTLPGDVLTNIVGPPLGKVSIVPAEHREWNINQAVVGFRPLGGMRNELLSIYLQSEVAKGWLRSTTKTTTSQVNLAVTTCRRLPVPLPPELEQERICETVKKALSYADDMLAAIRGSLSRSTALRQATLKAAFSGRLIRQCSSDEPALLLLEHIAAERGADNAVPKRGRKKKTTA